MIEMSMAALMRGIFPLTIKSDSLNSAKQANDKKSAYICMRCMPNEESLSIRATNWGYWIIERSRTNRFKRNLVEDRVFGFNRTS